MAFALPRPQVDPGVMEVYTKPTRPANTFVKHQEGAQVDTALESREVGEDADTSSRNVETIGTTAFGGL